MNASPAISRLMRPGNATSAPICLAWWPLTSHFHLSASPLPPCSKNLGNAFGLVVLFQLAIFALVEFTHYPRIAVVAQKTAGHTMAPLSNAFPLTHAEIGVLPSEVPPLGFNPKTAPADILKRYGILQQPSEGASLQYRKLWERMYPPGVNFVLPNFKSRAPTNRALAESIPAGRVQYNNWAGVGIDEKGKAITKVSATWTVPNLGVPPHVEEGSQCINSIWVGIDGFAPPNNDILQAGVDLIVSRQGSSLKVSIEPWWEWWKGQSFYFDKFPVSPGDVISCGIICDAGATTGTVTMTNSITRDHVSLSVPAPAGTKLIGNSAEWIVERQTADANSTTLTELSEFGSIFFDNAFAATAAAPKPEETLSAGKGTLITMTADDGTTMLAGPTLVGQNTTRIDRL